MQTKDIMELAPDVHIFRFKVLKAGKGGANLQYAMKSPKAQVLVTSILNSSKWEHKVGPAPRGAL